MSEDEDADLIAEREQMIFEDPREAPRTGATVLRRRDARLDLEVFAPLLVECLHVPKFEATKLCQLHHGVLVDNVAPEMAEAVAKALRDHGEECVVVPAAQIIKLPRPHPVHAMRLGKAGLQARGATEDWVAVPWESLACLTLAQVAVEEVRHTSRNMLATRLTPTTGMGAMGAVGGIIAPVSNTMTSKSSSQHAIIELVATSPLVYGHIDARQFDYSLLGDQLQTGSTANALTLARWLLTYAPQMRTNVDAGVLRQTGRVPLPALDAHTLREVTEWLTNLGEAEG